MRSSPNTPSSSRVCMTLCTTKQIRDGWINLGLGVQSPRRGKRSALSGYFNKEPGFHNLAKERPYLTSDQSINEIENSKLFNCQCFSSIEDFKISSIKTEAFNKLSSLSKNLLNLSHLR
uniref:Uncharacterized protein n=1 Tax=Romanomermis culicivorax TaxID=13658 RepID=A0A915I1H1_ROMCU